MADTSEFSAPSVQSDALPLMAVPAIDVRDQAVEAVANPGKPRRPVSGSRARMPSAVSISSPASGVLTYFPADTD
jgi:hypothetical protein